MTQHATLEDAVRQVEQDFKQITNGKFMCAVWHVDDDGLLHCHRTSWQFPTDRLWECRQLLDKALAINPEPKPLPLAPFLVVSPYDAEVEQADTEQNTDEVNGDENL